MCGRFAQAYELKEFIKRFGVAVLDGVGLRYNIAPGQNVMVLLHDKDACFEPRLLRWGLVPHWAKDTAIGSRMINARGETVAEKPAFRTAFRTHRCIVPVSGFFEWKRQGKIKVPHYIHSAQGEPLALGGLWAVWHDPQSGDSHETFTILTVPANEDVCALHDRMPLILNDADDSRWVDTQTSVDLLGSLIRPYADGQLISYPVSTIVNSPSNDTPDCIQKHEYGGQTELF